MHKGFEQCEKGQLGCVCAFILFFGSDLRGYNYEGNYCVWILWVGVRDITSFEGSVPALAMVESKLVAVDLAFFSGSAYQFLCTISDGKVQSRIKMYKRHQIACLWLQ